MRPPTEETLLEPPVTPAPVFAYRALRSIFFASPESSPERELVVNNKENMPTVSTRKSSLNDNVRDRRKQNPYPSPHKRKRDSGEHDYTETQIATAAMNLSPTKSILRVPGMPTPRAKSLRDVNVKFRSVSPELERKKTKNRNVDEKENGDELFNLDLNRKSTASKGSVKLSSKLSGNGFTSDMSQRKTAESTTPVQTETEMLSSSPITSEELEAYMRRTEKEMKKLVRYGQKMREYAQKQDQENARLSDLLEKARKDNERLKTRLQKIESEGNVACEKEKRKESDKNINVVKKDSRNGHVPETVITGMRSMKAVSDRHDTDRKLSFDIGQQSQLASLPRRSTSTSSLPSHPKVAKQPRPQNEHSTFNQDIKQSEPVKAPPSLSSDTISKSLQPHLPKMSTSIQQTSASTASDRLAAARERVRQKAQLRKTSAGLDGISGGESLVDWAGL